MRKFLHFICKAFPKLLLLLIGVLAHATPAAACTTCSRPLQAEIFTTDFFLVLLLLLLPFVLVWALVYGLHKLK
ncbi:hypothetical protein FVR03_16155 [Pontibacter qinzhouensis]|uniref:Uncharacterized protein n=1 Tax=Pontibacter qinzhouensis TaxID=2603253 RepID=A0A5C8JJC1_9BACT|nr:hypothetical protein [Pontibacter qinzhouensis]TXK37013.1 hypothetical protein FVR03_16155 [Pontibacter qinzhouensis]